MSIVNLKVVQRSWGLFELAARNPNLVLSSSPEHGDVLSYGPQFKYEEFLAFPTRLHSLLVTLFVVIVGTLMKYFSFVCAVTFIPSNYLPMASMFQARWLARWVMPQPGGGPTVEYVCSSSERSILSNRGGLAESLKRVASTSPISRRPCRMLKGSRLLCGQYSVAKETQAIYYHRVSIYCFNFSGHIKLTSGLYICSHDWGMCLVSRARTGPSPSVCQAWWRAHAHDCFW